MRNLLFAAIAGSALVGVPTTLSAQSAPQNPTETPTSASEANTQANPPPPTTVAERSTDPYQPDKLVTNYPGNLTPPPASALNKEYPVCGGPVQDSCQNPGEGGAPARLLAAGPASERD